ncbi:MobA/MobL family protein, partial [Rhizobium laguerreae]|nr:MobA/MobL family protein [Rhizobium laguerreae]
MPRQKRHRPWQADRFEGAIYVAGATCAHEVETAVAIMFVRAQVISRGGGRSIVSAAAYRHRTRMMDEQAGTSFSYRGGASELVHEELA